MQLMVVFEIVLLVAIVAGAFMMSERRSDTDRRHTGRRGRRAADSPAENLAEPSAR